MITRVRNAEERAETAYQNTIRVWGPAAKRLLDGKKPSYKMSYRALCIFEKNMDEAIKPLNQAIMERANHQQRLNFNFDPTPNLVDLALALKMRERPDVTDAEMRNHGLVYGELGVLDPC